MNTVTLANNVLNFMIGKSIKKVYNLSASGDTVPRPLFEIHSTIGNPFLKILAMLLKITVIRILKDLKFQKIINYNLPNECNTNILIIVLKCMPTTYRSTCLEKLL